MVLKQMMVSHRTEWHEEINAEKGVRHSFFQDKQFPVVAHDTFTANTCLLQLSDGLHDD